MSRICFIAQFPPPIHGLSKAVDTLFNSKLASEYDFEKVDITNNRKFLGNIIKISKSKADLFYFTISQTKGGNLRDLMILKLLDMQHKKCLVHLHGGYYRHLVDNDLGASQRKSNYKAVSKLAGAIVLGPSLKGIFSGMIDDKKIITVPNCVDDEYLMSDEEFEKKISSFNDRKIKHVLYLSNFIKTKGYPEVLKMAKSEKARVDNGEERRFHFDFAGAFFEKAEEDYFNSFIRDNQLEDYVTYHGIVSGAKKAELLKDSDIFVLLTRYPNEGQPISILEAMGNGMLIVTTNHAGIPDIVNEKNIICHSDDDYEKIDLSKVSAEIERINRDSVKKLYREDNYIANMDRAFREVLSDGSK